MDYVNGSMQTMANDFNWDDIEVGNHVLNHSQKFFVKKHIKHERLDESEEGMDLLKEIDAITLDDTFNSIQNKENVNNINILTPEVKKQLQQTVLNEDIKTDIQNIKTRPLINPGGKICRNQEESQTNCQSESSLKSLNEIKSHPTNTLILSESLIARNKARINPGANKNKADSESNTDDVDPALSKPIKLSESLIIRNKARINPGVKKEEVAKPTTSTTGNTVTTGTIAKQVTAPVPTIPHAYQCSELYRRKKKEQLRKCLDEERKKREFHSRPVPNFSACHKSLQQRKVLHAVTVPVTPLVLKKSRETEEKRKEKLDDIKKQIHPPKFESRPPIILNEEPFVPKKTQTVLVPCPFNLHSERRLQERKQYDATIQRVMEEKQKQEEEERKRREEQRIKELRKLTTFKARPNPFK